MSVSTSGSFTRFFQKRTASDVAEQKEDTKVDSGNKDISASSSGSELQAQHAMSPLGLRAREHALTIMAKHTFEEAKKEQLICDLRDDSTGREMLQGVALRVSKGNFAVFPREKPEMMPWITGLCLLNVGVSTILLLF